MPIHHSIRSRRRELGLTQEDLAARMEQYLPTIQWTWVTISKIERGLRRVKAEEIAAFARALECRVTTLLDPIPD